MSVLSIFFHPFKKWVDMGCRMVLLCFFFAIFAKVIQNIGYMQAKVVNRFFNLSLNTFFQLFVFLPIICQN